MPDAMTVSPIAGRRFLIAEDQVLLAAELELMLEEEGARVVGVAQGVSEALDLLERADPEAAVVDLNLNGEVSTDVARALSERRVPFVILTGYSESWMTFPEFQHARIADKPVRRRQLLHLLRQAIVEIA
jgi:DNA-binding NarL/FixJ family response regulator